MEKKSKNQACKIIICDSDSDSNSDENEIIFNRNSDSDSESESESDSDRDDETKGNGDSSCLDLSRVLKSKIMIDTTIHLEKKRKSSGFQEKISIDVLEEHIFKHLSNKDLLSLGMVNKCFYDIFDSDLTWDLKMKNEFHKKSLENLKEIGFLDKFKKKRDAYKNCLLYNTYFSKSSLKRNNNFVFVTKFFTSKEIQNLEMLKKRTITKIDENSGIWSLNQNYFPSLFCSFWNSKFECFDERPSLIDSEKIVMNGDNCQIFGKYKFEKNGDNFFTKIDIHGENIKIVYNDGDVETGKFENNQETGIFKYIYKNGDYFNVFYNNGVKEGESFLYNKNNILKSKRNFKNGQKNGNAFDYYPNGVVREEFIFHNDKVEGAAKHFYENGIVEEFNYSSEMTNIKHGSSTLLFPKQGTKLKRIMEYGILEGKAFFESEIYNQKYKYLKGKIIGESKRSFYNSKRKDTIFYKGESGLEELEIRNNEETIMIIKYKEGNAFNSIIQRKNGKIDSSILTFSLKNTSICLFDDGEFSGDKNGIGYEKFCLIQTYKGTYKDGKRHGLFTIEQEELKIETEFEFGRLKEDYNKTQIHFLAKGFIFEGNLLKGSNSFKQIFPKLIFE